MAGGYALFYAVTQTRYISRRSTLSHIPGTVSIAGELGQSQSKFKEFTLPIRNRFRTINEWIKDVSRMRYPGEKQYLAFPNTQEDPRILGTFARRRAGGGSWQMKENVSLLLTNWTPNGQRRGPEINSEVRNILSPI